MATTTDRADRRRAPPLSEAGKGATVKIYAGAPHGLAYKHKDQLNADLLAFLNA